MFDPSTSSSTAGRGTIGLAAVLPRNGRWSVLGGLRRRQIDATGDALVRAQLLEELALLQEVHLGQHSDAAVSWTRTAELRPGDARAWDEARRLYRSLGDLEMVLELNQRESGLVSSPERHIQLQVPEIDVLLDMEDVPSA